MGDKLEENGSDNQDDLSFEELLESYDSTMDHEIHQGEKIQGEILSIGSDSIYIGTGTKSDGVVKKSELLDKDGQLPYGVGDTIELYVTALTESEIILSKALSGAGSTGMLEDAAHSQTPVEGKVTGTIKGGYSVDLMGKRAFCPISQMDIKYIETAEDYVGNTFNFMITRFAEGGRNIVVSRRKLMDEELKLKKQAFLSTLSEGDILTGEVMKLMPYGAFIELIPGVEGMAHISELSWARVEKAEDVLKPGEKVQVKLVKFETKEDSENPRLALSLKQVSTDPWDGVSETIKTGDQVTGRVVRLAPFGAFVEIAPGLDGLVHISEMSHTRRVLKAEDVVSQGERVQVVVKSIDPENKRISLSIKDALGDPWVGAAAKFPKGTVVEGIVEKKEKFGLFITLEAGITGLMPASLYSRASKPSEVESLKPGNRISVMVEGMDEDNRRATLAPPDLESGDAWKKFTGPKEESMGTMGSLLMEALKKKK